jgi:membrane-associated phospholipid phosphatase
VQHGGAGPGLSRRLQAVALLSLIGFLGLALFAAGRDFSDVDYRTRALVEATRLPFLDVPMRAVSGLGDDYGVITLIVLGVGTLWRPRRRWALTLPLLMAGTGALQLVAKWAIDRPRPNLAAWGFPSGHTLTLVVFFGLVTYLLATSSLGRRWRWPGYAGCAAIVLAVAWSRLYLEAHWVSDVAGGFTLGIAYLLLTIGLVETVAHRRASARAATSTRSEAQVQLSHDERRVADVESVVVTV